MLRDKCLDEMIARKDKVAGYAIGGLSGGEEKGGGRHLFLAAVSETESLAFRRLLADVSRILSKVRQI